LIFQAAALSKPVPTHTMCQIVMFNKTIFACEIFHMIFCSLLSDNFIAGDILKDVILRPICK